MRNLLSHFIQQNYAAGNMGGEFTSAALFLDLSGFTAMTDALMQAGPPGAEVLVMVLSRVFEPLVHSVYAQGGFIARTAGDAFTALFPLEPGENSPETVRRMLAAALSMQTHLREHPDYPTPYGTFTVRGKIGLALGQVRWGIVSSVDGSRAAYYFQGSAVDSCAAAEHAAQPGEIILSQQVYDQISDRVETQPVETQPVETQHAASLPHHRLLATVSAALPEPQPVALPAPDPDVMRRFFPEALITQQHSGEFRQIVSLFVSLPTVRNEEQLASFMATVFALQDRYGGLLSSLDFGDKGSTLLLYWGAPLTYENDLQRALNFIIDLQEQTSIPILAGVTYHLAHAGFPGSAILDEYSCHGRGISLAARLMVAAGRGEIWVEEQVVRRTQAQFDFEPLGLKHFKGFSEPYNVYLLLERKHDDEKIFSGSMVGRTAELQTLSDFAAPLWQGGTPGTLVVWGEGGMGKSRLLYEFQNSALFAEHAALWTVCQASEILRAPLNPFRYGLRRYLELTEGQPEARSKRQFNRKLDDLIAATHEHDPALADELDRLRSFLGALVDLTWPDSLYEQLDPQARYENTLLGLITLLQAESLRQPVIVLLEDAHWLDEETRQFLPRLQRALTCDECKTYPVAVIAPARGEGQPELLGPGMRYRQLFLGGISTADLAELAQDILQGPATPDLLSLLMRRSEGNPFFAEQSLRYLVEQGMLVMFSNGWCIPGDVEAAPLPQDVGTLLVARLDALEQTVRRAVQTAAVLGREFEVALLSRMLTEATALDACLLEARQAAIWHTLDEVRYIFRHALMRDAAYAMQISEVRSRLHALAVEGLENLHAGEIPAYAGELAYHSRMAGLHPKAVTYLRLAGDAARSAYLNAQALEYYTEALNLLPADNVRERIDLLVDSIKLLRLTGELERRRQALDALQTVLGALPEHPDWRRHWAACQELWGVYFMDVPDYQQSLVYSQQAVHAASDDIHLKVNALTNEAYANLQLGRQEAAWQAAQQAYDLAQVSGSPRSVIMALNQLGLIKREMGQPAEAETHYRQGLEISGASGELRLEAMLSTNLATLAADRGDFSAARLLFEHALALVHQIGDRPKEGMLLANLAWLVGTQGDLALARQLVEQSLRIARAANDPSIILINLINLSAYSGRLGDVAGALETADQAVALASTLNERSTTGWALTYQGHARLAAGDIAGAGEAYRGALSIREALKQPNLACEPLAGLAAAALAGGDLAAAQAHVEAVLAFMEGGGMLAGADEPLRVYLACCRVLQASRDPRYPAVLGAAHDLLMQQAAGIENADLRGMFLEGIPYHRQLMALWANNA